MKILKPFKILIDFKGISFIWLIYIILFGNLGLIFFIIFSGKPIIDSLSSLLNNGTLFTFSIALLAALIGDFFIDLLKKEDIQFKSIKIIITGISNVLIIFLSAYYTAQFLSVLNKQNNKFILVEIILAIVSILTAVYIFCVNNMHLDYDNYKELEDNKLRRIRDRSQKTKNDGTGVEI